MAVTGDLDPHDLRKVARRVQEDLLELPGISRGEHRGGPPVRDFDRSQGGQAALVRPQFPGPGRRDSAFFDRHAGRCYRQRKWQRLSCGRAARLTPSRKFANIPIRSTNGSEVLLGDVAQVLDGFEEGEKVVEFNGKPALFVEVMRTGNESAIDISDKGPRVCQQRA